MITAKITAIQSNGMNSKKEFYVNEVSLSNGMHGMTWSKSENPPYKSGDEIICEPTANADGTHFFKQMKKVDTPSNGHQPVSTANMSKDDWRKKDIAIIYQNAFTQANAHLNAMGYDGKTRDNALKMLMDYADAIAQDVIKKSGI